MMGSTMRCIPNQAYRYWLELVKSFSLIKSVKMGISNKLLVNFPSMDVSNLSESLRSGVADFRILPIFRITMRPKGGAVGV